MCAMERCVVNVLQMGHNVDGLCEASTLCKCDRRNGDLFLSSTRLRHCALVSNTSDVLI